MKKTTVYILALVLLLSLLCACGDRNGNDNTTSPTPAGVTDNANNGMVDDDDGVITDGGVNDNDGSAFGNNNDNGDRDNGNDGDGVVGEIIDGANDLTPPSANVTDNAGNNESGVK